MKMKLLGTLGVGYMAWRTLLIVLALVGSSITMAAPAGAWEHDRVGVAQGNIPVPPHPMSYKVISHAYWNVKTAGQCHTLYPCFGDVLWTKDYQQGVMFFDHWFSPIDDAGMLADGIRWKSRKVTGAFEFCAVPFVDMAFCARHVGWVKIVIRTDGSSTVTTGLS